MERLYAALSLLRCALCDLSPGEAEAIELAVNDLTAEALAAHHERERLQRENARLRRELAEATRQPGLLLMGSRSIPRVHPRILAEYEGWVYQHQPRLPPDGIEALLHAAKESEGKG